MSRAKGGEPQLPTDRILPVAERAIAEHGSWRAFADSSKSPSVNERTYYRMLFGPWDERVPLRVADAIVTAVDPTLWHAELDDLLPATSKHPLPPVPPSKLTEKQIVAAHRLHQSGLSLGEIAEQVWVRYGYASKESCERALQQLMSKRGLQRVPPKEQNRLLTSDQLKDAHQKYMAGVSAAAVARERWEEWGYSSEIVAARALVRAFRSHGLEVRSHSEAVRLSRRKHRFGRRMGFIPADELALLIDRYLAGESLTDVARSSWERYGYSSMRQCTNSLKGLMERRGIPRRSRSEAMRIARQRHRASYLRKAA